MANVQPKMTKGGRSAAWIIAMTVTGSEITGSAASSYPMNHLAKAAPKFAISSDETGSDTAKITKLGIEGITFETDEETEKVDAISGATISGGAGAGNRPSTIQVDSLSTDAADDIATIKDLRGEVVLLVIAHGKSYKAGALVGIKYYAIVGKVTDISGPEFVGNDLSQISFTVTGGKTYTTTSGSDTEYGGVAGATTKMSNIIPAGTDAAGAGYAAPSLSGLAAEDLAALNAGDVIIV